MTNKKSTKKALLTSALSLILCLSMLVGTTFAWFTDEVKSGTNIIAAGNLDIELYHSNLVDTPEKVNGGTKLFNEVYPSLWEPGAVAFEVLTVANEGTLALKYNLAFHALNATVVNGKSLADALKIAVVDATKLTSREAAIEAGKDSWKPLASFDLPETLEAGQTHTYGVVIYWEPTENDNDFNMNNENQGKTLSIELGVHLTATQKMSENDSYGPDYDDSAYLSIVTTEAELKAALENNASVQLGADIVLTGEWKPIGDKDAGIYYTGTLDGNGHTISGLNVGANDYDALISAAKDAVIKNLTVEGVVDGVNAAGIVARVEGNTIIENCVNNVTVKGTTKAGGIACNVTGANAKIINCVNNADISGGKDGIGGIVGYVNNDTYLEIINCTNNGNVTSDVNKYAGAAVGYGAKSTGLVVDFTNTGVITGTLAGGNRFLKDGDTVLVGYVNTPGAWKLGATPSTIQSVINAAQAGDVIVLTAGEYHDAIVMKSGITLQGSEGAVVGCVKLNNADNVAIKNVIFDAAGAQAMINVNGTLQYYANIFNDNASGGDGSTNVLIEGCTFTGKYANGGAAIGTTRQRLTGDSNFTIRDCTFMTEGAYYNIYTYYSGNNGSFVIENNTFKSQFAGGGAIYLGRYQSSVPVVLKNNTFENAAALSDVAYIQAHGADYTVSFDAADNIFNG